MAEGTKVEGGLQRPGATVQASLGVVSGDRHRGWLAYTLSTLCTLQQYCPKSRCRRSISSSEPRGKLYLRSRARGA